MFWITNDFHYSLCSTGVSSAFHGEALSPQDEIASTHEQEHCSGMHEVSVEEASAVFHQRQVEDGLDHRLDREAHIQSEAEGDLGEERSGRGSARCEERRSKEGSARRDQVSIGEDFADH